MESGEDDDFMNCSYEADNPEEVSNASENLSVEETDLTCLDDSVFSSNASSLAPDDDSFSIPLDEDGPAGRANKAASSTPKKTKKNARGGAKKGKPTETNNNIVPSTVVDPIFKKPAPAPIYFAMCPECGQKLKTSRGFTNHTLNHKWKKLASRVPPKDQITAHCHEVAQSIIQKIKDFDWPGINGKALKDFSCKLEEKLVSEEWNIFFSIVRDIVLKGFSGFDIKSRSITFAATSRRLLIEHINNSLGDRDIQCHLFECLKAVQECSTEIGLFFIQDFIRKLGNSALAFYFKTLSGRESASHERRKRSKDDFNHELSHYVVYYIAGSCMKSIIRHCYSHYKSEKLQRRRICVVTKFGRPNGCSIARPRHKSYWTQLLNRKSLFFVNDEAFPFFLELAVLLQSMEKPDGSLGHSEVMKRVVDQPSLLLKWSNIVECELDEEESFQLMVKVIRIITNTFGRGVLYRRMNTMWRKGKGNKSTVSISHRARLL